MCAIRVLFSEFDAYCRHCGVFHENSLSDSVNGTHRYVYILRVNVYTGYVLSIKYNVYKSHLVVFGIYKTVRIRFFQENIPSVSNRVKCSISGFFLAI